MNLAKLFETQKLLDDRIVDEHNLYGQDLLPQKILALQVELGELANELPEVFKFWSNKKNDYDKALKEYVDCLHFILSIGLEIKTIGEQKVEEFRYWSFIPHNEDVVTTISSLMMSFFTFTDDKEKYVMLFCQFIGLGEMIGFTPEQIEKSYYTKNAINHTRQDNKY